MIQKSQTFGIKNEPTLSSTYFDFGVRLRAFFPFPFFWYYDCSGNFILSKILHTFKRNLISLKMNKIEPYNMKIKIPDPHIIVTRRKISIKQFIQVLPKLQRFKNTEMLNLLER